MSETSSPRAATSSPRAAASAADTDAQFAQLLAQQVEISQSMYARHQVVVTTMRQEIEALRNELAEKDPGALSFTSSSLEILKSAKSISAPVLAIVAPPVPTFALPAKELGEKMVGSPMVGSPSVAHALVHQDLEEAEAVLASFDSHAHGGEDAVSAFQLRQQSSEMRVRSSLTAKRQKAPFADDSEEVLRPPGRQRHSTRSPSGDMHGVLPGQVSFRSPSGDIIGTRRSISTDTFGMQGSRRGSAMEALPNRSSIVSESGGVGSRSSTHRAAAARARTAEMRRNSSRTQTNDLPSVGPRATSAPALDQVELSLEPYETWIQLADEAILEERRASMQSYTAQTNRLSVQHGKVTMDAKTRSSRLLKAMIMEPDSKRRLLWLVFSLLLIAYDMILVPLSVYNLDISSFEHPMTMLSATFWTLDFCLAFFVGYYVSGTLELRPHKTARNYAQTWMMPDLILLMFEWVDVLTNIPSLPSLIRSTRSFRILRFLKSAKLLRAAKLPGFFRYLPMFITRSEYITLSLGIVRHLLGILFINHVIASFWYLLGQESGGWVEVYEIPVADWWYSYLITLHWSLTQFTPASMGVLPQTISERAFNVAVVIFALVTFSSFVSSITNLMTHLRNLESGERIMFSKLEDFMQSRKFSFYLTIRVRRYLDQRLAEKRSKPEEGDIELLQRLSEPLKMEVHFEMHSPTLTKHPLLFAYSRLNEPAMMKLCHTALRTMQLSGDDYLFTKGETAKTMYFAMSGSLVYTREDEPAPYQVQAPAYFSEMVLWCPWSHCGSMRAKTDCKILGLDAAKFFDVVQHAKICQLEVCAYAERALHIQNKYFDKDSRSDLNVGKYDARRIVKKTFPKGSLDVRPAWWGGGRSLNRHNSAGLMGMGLRRQLSSQVSQPSDSDVSSDSSVERFSVRKRIVEQENERDLMVEGGRERISQASKTSRTSKKSEASLPPLRVPPSLKPQLT